MDLKLTLVDSFEHAEALLRWLGNRRPVLGVDTETTGLDFWRDDLRVVQVGDLTHGWALPFPEWGGFAREVLSRYTEDMVMHNAKFDLHFLEKERFPIPRSQVHDTRVLAHLLDNDDRTSLKYLASKYVDRNADALESQLNTVMKDNHWGWHNVPTDHPAYWQYSALDPVITVALFDLMASDTRSSYLEAYEIEMAAQQVLTDMETRGIRVDVTYAQDPSYVTATASPSRVRNDTASPWGQMINWRIVSSRTVCR